MKRKVTDSQINDVKFCEDMLHISFTGSLHSVQDVEEFLFNHFEEAEEIYSERLEDEYRFFKEYWDATIKR